LEEQSLPSEIVRGFRCLADGEGIAWKRSTLIRQVGAEVE